MPFPVEEERHSPLYEKFPHPEGIFFIPPENPPNLSPTVQHFSYYPVMYNISVGGYVRGFSPKTPTGGIPPRPHTIGENIGLLTFWECKFAGTEFCE